MVRFLTRNCCCHGLADGYASLAIRRAVQQNSESLDGPRSGVPVSVESQVDLLWRDIAETRRVVEEEPVVIQRLADFTDLAVQSRVLVTTDLAWRMLHHSIGVHVLLREEVPDSLLVVQRAVFEVLTTLAYLHQTESPETESLVFLAYSHLKRIKVFASQEALVAEREEILRRMPDHAVRTARKRLKNRPHTWSGKTIRRMAEAAGITGYDDTFDFLSGEAHASTVGDRVRVQPDEESGQARVLLGSWVSSPDEQAQANFTRRALKHSFRILWEVVDGPKVSLRTPDPDEWTGNEPL